MHYKCRHLYTFAKYIKVSDLVSATLEGSCNQLRALSLQILLSYQMLQPIALTNIVTIVYILRYQRM